MEFIQEHWTEIFAVLFAVSELISLLPGMESNGILQAVMNILRRLSPPKEEQLEEE